MPFAIKSDICYNVNMKREVYYIISCTSEENQSGIFHYSEPYRELKNAKVYAKKRREFLGNDGHVAIEKHHERYERNDWQIDHDNGGAEQIDYF